MPVGLVRRSIWEGSVPPASLAREHSTSSSPTSRSAWRSERHRMKAIFLLLFATLSWVAAAQTPDGISAPASRTLALTAHEPAFSITFAATLDSTEHHVEHASHTAVVPN